MQYRLSSASASRRDGVPRFAVSFVLCLAVVERGLRFGGVFATQGIGFVVDGNLTIKFLSRHFFRQKIRSVGLPESIFFGLRIL